MRLNVKGALAAVAAATIALSTVALQPAEARGNGHHNYYHRHHNGAGPVILGALGAMALIAGASEYGYYGYPEPYAGYPYGPAYPYWNGSHYVYGPGYGGPVYGPPGVYWR